MKFNQIWCVSYWHEGGVQRQTKIWPCPLGRGQKVKYHFISVTKSVSKIFIPNFVCVLTNERYKHIRQDFHSVAWVMPQGWDFGALGVPRWSKIYFIQIWSCGISNGLGWRAEQNASKIFILGSHWWPWGEVKGQISLDFDYHVNFEDFIPNFVCGLTIERCKTYQTRFLFCRLGHAPGVRLLGTGGAQWAFFFSPNMVMWHIKSTGMTRKTECK